MTTAAHPRRARHAHPFRFGSRVWWEQPHAGPATAEHPSGAPLRLTGTVHALSLHTDEDDGDTVHVTVDGPDGHPVAGRVVVAAVDDLTALGPLGGPHETPPAA